MTDEISILKYISPIIIKAAGRIADFAATYIERKFDILRSEHKLGFEKLISRQNERLSHIRTIISSNIPLAFSSIYVNLNINSGYFNADGKSRGIRDIEMTSICSSVKKSAITGTAGTGKTMFMRFMYFKFIEDGKSVPIFIELKELNRFKDTRIIDYILGYLKEYIPSFTRDQLNHCLENGIFILIFDGLDEVDFDQRPNRMHELNFISNLYSELIILISSRPDRQSSGWGCFHVYHIMSFDKNQVLQLINKLPYNYNSKRLFIDGLKSGLYEKHHDFLVNPLLAIMLLITIDQYIDVPAKIHLFYEYAFEALFIRHDATKDGGFIRKRNVNLAMDDYMRLFSYFCTILYLKEVFQFSELQALETIERGINISQIQTDKVDFLIDLVNCSCMLSRDGVEYIFSHRSFQEYFVAYFFSRVKNLDFGNAARTIINRSSTDQILLMISEMNRENFESDWALPQITKAWFQLNKIKPKISPFSYVRELLNLNVLTASIKKNISIGFKTQSNKTDLSLNSYLDVLFRIYKPHYKSPKFSDIIIGDKMSEFIDVIISRTNMEFLDLSMSIEFEITDSDSVFFLNSSLVGDIETHQMYVRDLYVDIKKRVDARRVGLDELLK